MAAGDNLALGQPRDPHLATNGHAPGIGAADRHNMLVRQVQRLSELMRHIEHQYADLLAGPEADLGTAIRCCRASLERAVARHPPSARQVNPPGHRPAAS